MINILESIICSTFEKEVERNQNSKGTPYGMLVSFRKQINYNVEEGYRNVHLLIYAPHNYVAVFAKEDWTVIPLHELENDDEDTFVKKGCDYRKGETPWKMLSYHDSCWRSDGIHNFLWYHKDELSGINTLENWYQRVEITNELYKVLEPMMMRRGDDYHYEPGKGVLYFTEKKE